MSLTKEDLQAIGELMDSKIEPLSKRMDGFDKQIEMVVRKEIEPLSERMDRLEETVQSVHESQIETEAKLSDINKQLEYLIDNSKKTNDNEKRITTLEDITNKLDTRVFILEKKKAV